MCDILTGREKKKGSHTIKRSIDHRAWEGRGTRICARKERGAEVVPTLVGSWSLVLVRSWSLVRAPTQAWTGPTTCGCICGGGGAAAAAAAAAAVGPAVASPRNSRNTAWPPSARTARSMPGCWSSVKTRAKAVGTDRALAGRLSQSEESRSTSFVMGRRCDAIQGTMHCMHCTPDTATHKIELCQSEVLAPTDPCGGLLLEVRRASAASLS